MSGFVTCDWNAFFYTAQRSVLLQVCGIKRTTECIMQCNITALFMAGASAFSFPKRHDSRLLLLLTKHREPARVQTDGWPLFHLGNASVINTYQFFFIITIIIIVYKRTSNRSVTLRLRGSGPGGQVEFRRIPRRTFVEYRRQRYARFLAESTRTKRV